MGHTAASGRFTLQLSGHAHRGQIFPFNFITGLAYPLAMTAVAGVIFPKQAQGSLIEKDGKVTPLDVKEGDTILFGKYSGQEIKLDGEEFLIMREDEVLAVLAGK